jgi:hypothetical protein
LGILCSAVLFVSCVAPAAVAQSSPAMVDGAIEELKAGNFLWAPDIAPEGPVTLIVSLRTQRAYVYRNGLPIGVTTISSGQPGHDTPTGIFTILQKARDHKSNLYANAPMPFMQRLTWDGIALHAGNLPGYPASHGCIRLPLAFAKLLYGVTKLGLTVVITDDAVVPEVSAPPETLDPARSDERPSLRVEYVWRPDRSPVGPVSIVVSGKDKRIVVLRNGIEIGSADIVIDGPIQITEAFTLRAVSDGDADWLRIALPGQKPGAAEMTLEDRARAHLPPDLQKHIRSILQPGATLLVTRDSLRSSGTGHAITVIEVEPG